MRPPPSPPAPTALKTNLDVTKAIHHEGHEDQEGRRSENLDLSGGNLMSSGVIVRPEQPTLPFSLRALRVLRGEDFVSLGLTARPRIFCRSAARTSSGAVP